MSDLITSPCMQQQRVAIEERTSSTKRFLEQLAKKHGEEHVISTPDSIAADIKRSELEEKIRVQQQIVDRLQQQRVDGNSKANKIWDQRLLELQVQRAMIGGLVAASETVLQNGELSRPKRRNEEMRTV